MYGARYFGGRYFGRRYFGKTGDTSAGYFWGQRYFGPRYFGRRYFASTPDSAPFTTAQTAGLSASGTITLSSITVVLQNDLTATVTQGVSFNGSISANATPLVISDTAFIAAAPLEIAAAGVLTYSGVSVVLGYTPSPGVGRYFGSGYFGPRYFGPRYWSTFISFEASVTTGLSISGTTSFSGTPAQTLLAVVSNQIDLTGALTLDPATIVLSDVISQPEQTPTGGYGRGGKKRKKQSYPRLPTIEEVREERELLGILPKKARQVINQVVERATEKVEVPKQAALLAASYTHDEQISRLEKRLRGEFEKANVKLRDEMLGVAQAIIIDRLREKADKEELARLVTTQRLEEQEMQEVLDLWLNL